MPFVHLRLHTEYSLLDGIVRVPELMAAVAAAGMPAVALTDQSNLFAMVKFYKEAQSAASSRLIGVDAWIREPRRARTPPARLRAVPVPEPGRLPQSDPAGDALLPRGAATRRADDRARVARAAAVAGLIVLSGGPEGDIGQALARGTRRRGGALPRRAGRRCAAIASTSRCSAPAGPANRRYAEAVLDLARARGVAGGRDQRRALPDASVISRRTRPACASTTARMLADPGRRAALLRGAVPQEPRGDGGAVRRCAGTARQHASRWPSAARWRSGWAPRCCPPIRCPPAAPPRISCARNPSAASSARLALASARRNSPRRRRRLSGAPGPGTRRHLQHGLRGILPDRGRLHPLGARKRRAGGTRPRLGRGLAGGVRARRSRTSIRSSTICCSSDS